jgi:site-specific DNA-methyltransferase (adenine-specific)
MLLFGRSEEELKKLPSNSVDLCITSPPYKNKDGYSPELIHNVFSEVYRLQRKNTLLFFNFGHLVEDKGKFRPFEACKTLMDIGYKLNETIVWVKNHYRPIQGRRRLNNLTEFIFMLYKGKMPVLDRLAIGVPYADKSNVTRFAKGNDLKCGGNVWYIDYETIQSEDEKEHNDRFPAELPERCIKLCAYPVKTVLDPFCGSGTTGVVAQAMGKEFIGVEKNASHYRKALTKLEPELKAA